MIRGSRPIVCHWCNRCVAAVISLFVNGHGWTDCCADCEQVHEDGRR